MAEHGRYLTLESLTKLSEIYVYIICSIRVLHSCRHGVATIFKARHRLFCFDLLLT